MRIRFEPRLASAIMAAATSSERDVMGKLAGLSQAVGSAQRKGKMTGGMIPGKIMSQVQALATPDSISTLDKMGMLTKLGPLAPVLIGMSGMNKGGKKGGKKGGSFFKKLGGSKGKGNNIDLGALQKLGSLLGGGGSSGMAGMAAMAGAMGSKMPGLGGGGGRGVFNPADGLDMQDARALAGMATRSENQRGPQAGRGFDPSDGLDMQDARALAGMATRSENPGQRGPQGRGFDPSDGLDMEDARGMYDAYRGQSEGRAGGHRNQSDPRAPRGAPSGYDGRGGPRFDMSDGLDMEDMQAVAGRVGGKY
ncbi:uncharacterized protein LOC144867432 [Branchiostoma floridae x Branchiostoma japonicum]